MESTAARVDSQPGNHLHQQGCQRALSATVNAHNLKVDKVPQQAPVRVRQKVSWLDLALAKRRQHVKVNVEQGGERKAV